MTVNGDPTDGPGSGHDDGRGDGRGDGPGFRSDIEGLRGIAVLLVVLFHAGLPIPGGFIGLLDRPSVMTDGAAAALSVSNIRFALAEGSYFTAIGQPSPFLHFWSLSVEEQFYLVWPALLLFVARGRRRWVGAVLIAVLAGSFAANLYLTETSISWAFYSLPTRAWQLALGGLLAVAGTWPNRLPRIVGVLAALAGWAALAGLVAAAMLIGERTPYPGTAALAPAVAGAVLIASGTARWGAGLILSSTPIRFLGRISYSLYLWHWPILVLVPLAVGTALQ